MLLLYLDLLHIPGSKWRWEALVSARRVFYIRRCSEARLFDPQPLSAFILFVQALLVLQFP